MCDEGLLALTAGESVRERQPVGAGFERGPCGDKVRGVDLYCPAAGWADGHGHRGPANHAGEVWRPRAGLLTLDDGNRAVALGIRREHGPVQPVRDRGGHDLPWTVGGS